MIYPLHSFGTMLHLRICGSLHLKMYNSLWLNTPLQWTLEDIVNFNVRLYLHIQVHCKILILVFTCTTQSLSFVYQALSSFVSCAIITLSWEVKRPWMNLVFPTSTLNEFVVSYFHDMSDMEHLWLCIPTLEEDKVNIKVKEARLQGSLRKRTTKLRIKKTKVNI